MSSTSVKDLRVLVDQGRQLLSHAGSRQLANAEALDGLGGGRHPRALAEGEAEGIAVVGVGIPCT
jgi:hypothetical protein